MARDLLRSDEAQVRGQKAGEGLVTLEGERRDLEAALAKDLTELGYLTRQKPVSASDDDWSSFLSEAADTRQSIVERAQERIRAINEKREILLQKKQEAQSESSEIERSPHVVEGRKQRSAEQTRAEAHQREARIEDRIERIKDLQKLHALMRETVLPKIKSQDRLWGIFPRQGTVPVEYFRSGYAPFADFHGEVKDLKKERGTFDKLMGEFYPDAVRAFNEAVHTAQRLRSGLSSRYTDSSKADRSAFPLIVEAYKTYLAPIDFETAIRNERTVLGQIRSDRSSKTTPSARPLANPRFP